MKVKLVVLSLTVSLSSVAFAWGFFGPSAKDVENAFIERWEPTSHHILHRAIEDKLEMKSVKATKTERKNIWKVTYTLVVPYTARKGAAQGTSKGGSSNVTGQQKGSVGTILDDPFRPGHSILDQAAEDESNMEVMYKRTSYISVYSVHKRDGKLVLKSLPVPADIQ